MAKRDKLYTVNKWNKPLFEEQLRRRLYGKGGGLGYNPYLHEDLASTVYGYGNTGGVDANVKLPSYLDKAFRSYSDYTNGFQNLAKTNYTVNTNTPSIGPSFNQINQDQSSQPENKTDSFSKFATALSSSLNYPELIKSLKSVISPEKTTTLVEPTVTTTAPKAVGTQTNAGIFGIRGDGTPFNFAKSSLSTELPMSTADALANAAKPMTEEAAKHASDMIAKDIAEATGGAAASSTSNFWTNGAGKGLILAAMDIGGGFLRKGLSGRLTESTAGLVGNAIRQLGNLGGGAISGPYGFLAKGIADTIALGVDQFGSIYEDNGVTDYTRRINSIDTNGSNEQLGKLLANITLSPYRAESIDGIFANGNNRQKARVANEGMLTAVERKRKEIGEAIRNNNYDQMQNAMRDYYSSAMGGKLNRCNCNKKSYGGYLNSATPTGFNFLSDLTNLQMQKNQNNQDMSTSLGNTFIGTPDTTSFFAAGGPIHIKKSHRGRLTELKKRTGKTEAELYNDGNTAHRKMVTFARNSRKWRKAYGGFLNAANEFAQAQLNMYAGGGDKNKKKKSNPRPITTSGAGYVPDYNDNVVPNLVNHVRFPMGAATNRRNPWWSVAGSAVNIGGAMLPAISGSMGAIGVPFGLGLQAIENRNETEYIHDYEQRKKSGQATTPEEDKAYQWYLNHPDVLENRRNDWKQMNRKANGGKIEKKDKDIRQYSFFPGASMYELGGTLLAAGSNWGSVSEAQTSVPNKGYNVGDVIEIDEAEAELLKKLGYEYKIVG